MTSVNVLLFYHTQESPSTHLFFSPYIVVPRRKVVLDSDTNPRSNPYMISKSKIVSSWDIMKMNLKTVFNKIFMADISSNLWYLLAQGFNSLNIAHMT